MTEDLKQMAREIRRLGLESAFPTIHHFSSSKFRSRPSTLDQFVDHCDPRNLRDGENPQTIRRALAVCRNRDRGMSREAAIAAAWEEYQLVTR